jgi:hypothetical protein
MRRTGRVLDISTGRVNAVFVSELSIEHHNLFTMRVNVPRKCRAWVVSNDAGRPSIFFTVTRQQASLNAGHWAWHPRQVFRVYYDTFG